MAKIISICYRTGVPINIESRLENIAAKLQPKNISSQKPKIIFTDSTVSMIINPNSTIVNKENSILLGMILGDYLNWHVPGNYKPDGSYAIFRDNELFCEGISDFVASRSIWYYFDKEVFISSTSQRAIILLIKSFRFNKNIIPWMLSTGSLGPQNSYDTKINLLPPNSSITLNKKSWLIEKKTDQISFEIKRKSTRDHKNELANVLNETFKQINLDYKKWILPLSGGYDSRAILFLLYDHINRSKIKTITWGLESSLNQPKNDAYIAKVIADKLGLIHKYYVTDIPDENIEDIINKFIQNGEGRVDHISGYVDGFKIWKTLYENDVKGIIRGDEGFGWQKVTSTITLRDSLGMLYCQDIPNLKKFNFPEQKLPVSLTRRNNETLSAWRDRLYYEYRIPIVLAALSDIKLSYVELINPLLSRSILKKVLELPDYLRNDKKLFRNIVKEFLPNIQFAKFDAIPSPNNIFEQHAFQLYLIKQLNTIIAKELFDDSLLNYVLSGLNSEKTMKKKLSVKGAIKSRIVNYLPKRLKLMLKNTIGIQPISINILAFRMLIICKMYTILTKDGTE